jgi:putative membrane protein
MQRTVNWFDKADVQRVRRMEQITGWIKTGLLIGLAAYFAYNILTGNLANYINERFVWLSYVAVVLFGVLAVGNVLDLLQKRKTQADDDFIFYTGHQNTGIPWWVIGVAAVPLLLGTLVPSRPLGAAAINGDINFSSASVTSATTFTTDPLKWNVLDWLRAFNQETNPDSFTGRQADVIGFVYHEPSFPADVLMVARFTVSCCVADASAIALPVRTDQAATLTADSWIRVQGSFEVGEFRGDLAPILVASSIEPITQPDHPYLYP